MIQILAWAVGAMQLLAFLTTSFAIGKERAPLSVTESMIRQTLNLATIGVCTHVIGWW